MMPPIIRFVVLQLKNPTLLYLVGFGDASKPDKGVHLQAGLYPSDVHQNSKGTHPFVPSRDFLYDESSHSVLGS